MRVLFLYTSTNMCRDGVLWYYDEAAAVVASCLRRAGHTVHFRTVNHEDVYEDVVHWVEEHAGEKTLLVFMTSLMFSAFGHDLPDTFDKVVDLKKAFGFPAAFVGVYATLNPEEVIHLPGIDFVGRGEMEEALVELCDALDAGQSTRAIANFWVKENGTIHQNALRPLVPDLNQLPFPARDLLPSSCMANERDGILTVVASRGCPMQCNFCSNSVIREIYRGGGRYFRIKTVDYLLEEIRAALVEHPETRAVFFQEDVFGLTPEWIQELLARYPAEVGLPWGCNLLVRQVESGFVVALREAGCRQVQVGIESGSAYLRNQVLQKGVSDEQIQHAMDVLRGADILTTFYAMMGFPGETRRRFAESVRHLARYRPDMIQIQIWEAVRGSSLLGNECGEKRKRQGRESSRHRRRRERHAWRTRFFFRYFHGIVALHEELESRRAHHPLLARLASGLVSLAIWFPWTPSLLQARAANGRRRFAALWMENPWIQRLAARWFGRFWNKVAAREIRLASLYIWPEDLGDPPGGAGWVNRTRLDMRELADRPGMAREPARSAGNPSA
jgi:radical SAM superfamily enzyme YgiQ (UPF0313 family)